MDFKEQIRKAGLTEKEAVVYQLLLELGPRGAGTISRRTGIHRRTIYDIADRLIKKGLIGYIIENNKKLFHASNPQRFLEIIEEEKNEINSVVPQMLEFYNQIKETERHDTVFFRGKNGLKSVFEDQLETIKKEKSKENKEILILGASPLAYEILDIYFHWFDKKRLENKIKTRIIFNEKIKRRISLSEIRYLPKQYSSPLAVNIYGDKVAIILWSKENPLAIVIKQKEISEGYKKYFELMWKIAKQ
jgi:sugar-specific transcriptional regulator TrmB